MMRYTVIDPCNGYTYKGNGFLVVIGYGGQFNVSGAASALAYLVITDSHGTTKHSLWYSSTEQPTTLGALSITYVFNPGIMVNGDKLASSVNAGSDVSSAIECDTLEEAAQLL